MVFGQNSAHAYKIYSGEEGESFLHKVFDCLMFSGMTSTKRNEN